MCILSLLMPFLFLNPNALWLRVKTIKCIDSHFSFYQKFGLSVFSFGSFAFIEKESD